jgi:hypothetical protein
MRADMKYNPLLLTWRTANPTHHVVIALVYVLSELKRVVANAVHNVEESIEYPCNVKNMCRE